MLVVAGGNLEGTSSRWSFVPAIALLLTACGTTLQAVDTKTARRPHEPQAKD